MAVPLWGRVIAAVAGGLMVVIVWGSVIGALIVPRLVASRLTRMGDRCVNAVFQTMVKRIRDFHRRDRVLSVQAAALLLGQLAVWLVVAYLGFALLLWPFEARGVTAAFIAAGSSLFTLGFDVPPGTVPSVVVFLAAGTGLVVLTLQIAYLPTLYAAFNRRETDVALLNARAGVPSWGPELLARTHYALGSDVSTLDTMPDLYAQWERWAADVAESHTTYLTLVRFRSPRPLSSWVTALLAVMDSAAMYLALSPKSAPTVPARLCLRSGLECFRRIAQAMGFDVPDEADPNGHITLTYEEFVTAVERLKEVDFPIERDPADAWPDFVGWRINYEDAAYLVADAVDAVHAMWSGPRVFPGGPVAPIRPGRGRVTDGDARDPLSPRRPTAGTRTARRAPTPLLAPPPTAILNLMSELSYRESILVACPPDELYNLVSDVTRMGQWSPICAACWWDEGGGPRVGAWFTGRNQTPQRTWETRSQVVVADPGREFAFEVNHGFVRWGYTFTPADGGTELTESWNFLPKGIAGFHDRYGDDAEAQIAERTSAAHDGIPVTLAAIKKTAESS